MPHARFVERLRTSTVTAVSLAASSGADVENEPVLPFAAVGAHLADMADAALAAALDLAEATVCGDDAPCRLAVIAMGNAVPAN